MNQHQRIIREMESQYEALSEAVFVHPAALAHACFEAFTSGTEDPHICYASLEHLKQMARAFLRRRKDPDGDDSEAYKTQSDLPGLTFSGHLQDRYPLPRRAGEDPVYKLRQHLTPDERQYNVEQLRKAGQARMEHARALEAEGQADYWAAE